MSLVLMLRLDGPLQSWGTVARDPKRPTQSFPTRSALAGMLASALGWRYRDGRRTTALQDALRYAVREDRAPVRVRDYHTADLGRIGFESWTRWGMERRGGSPSAARGTQILEKEYLADGVFMVALGLAQASPVTVESIAEALRKPARPLFLGRKGCLPASTLLVGQVQEDSPYAAVAQWPADPEDVGGVESPRLRCWYAPKDGPDTGEPTEVWDRRDFETDRFAGSRTVLQGWVEPPVRTESGEGIA